MSEPEAVTAIVVPQPVAPQPLPPVEPRTPLLERLGGAVTADRLMAAVFAAGIVALSAGCWLVYRPAGLICAGVLLLFVSFAWARGGRA